MNTLAETPILILAGGLGTRLRSVVADRPKGLAPIGDAPFLQLQMSLLAKKGARRFVLCIGHMAEQIQDTFGDGSSLGVQIEYSLEKDQLLGTAGALKLAEKFFAPTAIAVNGDTYLDADYQGLLDHHHAMKARHGAVATLTLSRLEDGSRFGTVLLDESGEFVRGFREKQAGGGPGWLNAGAYVLEKALIDTIPTGKPVSIERDTFPGALASGMTIAAARCAVPFYDIGTPDDLERFRERYRKEFSHAA